MLICQFHIHEANQFLSLRAKRWLQLLIISLIIITHSGSGETETPARPLELVGRNLSALEARLFSYHDRFYRRRKPSAWLQSPLRLTGPRRRRRQQSRPVPPAGIVRKGRRNRPTERTRARSGIATSPSPGMTSPPLSWVIRSSVVG